MPISFLPFQENMFSPRGPMNAETFRAGKEYKYNTVK